MKKVFLFDPTTLSYREKIYDFFISEFSKYGVDLYIYYEKEKCNIQKDKYIGIEYTFKSFKELHKNEKPDVSIFFIWLSYTFSIPFLAYLRLFSKTKSIVWSKGINITNINQPFKNQIYYLRQRLADALILYSEFEKQFIITNKEKVFVANNTINNKCYNTEISGEEVIRFKQELSIKENKVVLFVGRIEKRKNVDILLEVFSRELNGIALLIVGPGLSHTQEEIIKGASNIYATGAIYDIERLSLCYQLADIFCIPGHLGLGINEAFLFGVPVVTENMSNSNDLVSSEPMMLFKDNYNGLFFNGNANDLSEKLELLANNNELRDSFS